MGLWHIAHRDCPPGTNILKKHRRYMGILRHTTIRWSFTLSAYVYIRIIVPKIKVKNSGGEGSRGHTRQQFRLLDWSQYLSPQLQA